MASCGGPSLFYPFYVVLPLFLLTPRSPGQLPPAFARAAARLWEADLLIVIGTSLTVHPFASLAYRVPSECPRVLINLEAVGGFGSRTDDVLLLGKCDEVVVELCALLGWEDERREVWAEGEAAVEVEAEPEANMDGKVGVATSVDNDSGREVERLTGELERVLGLKVESLSEKEAATSTTAESKDGDKGPGDDTKEELPALQTKSDGNSVYEVLSTSLHSDEGSRVSLGGQEPTTRDVEVAPAAAAC